MLPLCITRPQETFFGGADWTSLGLVSCIIGAFLIANSTLFEHPRSLVGRYFGRSMGRLQSVREYVYNRVQTTLGFAFLLAGFGFQLIGRFREVVPEGSGPVEPPLSMAWVGVIVASAIILLFSGWWWSVWAFRRYVREYFTDNPRDFMAEPAVAREVGELFGIESSENDTVEDYVKRLVKETGLPQRGGGASMLSGSLGGSRAGALGSTLGAKRGPLPPGGAAPNVGGFAGAASLPEDFE
ncbi:hypothetical protein Poly30_23980 [Planctomycetes bacterium Poly30]|uniref:Uncharacterized protein n=1 Tax=Saltatorellus ferox TaxID=2528018 RepID=A0A518ES11_9BACT|nr:hypothetical protein Poly30_23980 [Planctomycetes bacterium Poly30]